MLCQRVIPIQAMQPGYRHLDLRNGFNKPLGPSLFVHIEIQDYVSDAHRELVDALQNPIQAAQKQQQCNHLFKKFMQKYFIFSE